MELLKQILTFVTTNTNNKTKKKKTQEYKKQNII